MRFNVAKSFGLNLDLAVISLKNPFQIGKQDTQIQKVCVTAISTYQRHPWESVLCPTRTTGRLCFQGKIASSQLNVPVWTLTQRTNRVGHFVS